MSKSFDANKFQEQQCKAIALKFNCTSCMNGTVLKNPTTKGNGNGNVNGISSSLLMTASPASSNKNQMSDQNYHQATNYGNGDASPNMSNSMPWRKKSLGLNNPPLPVPMQPVRESSSRSPSPTSMQHQSYHANNYNNPKALSKRQSAPVNVPKNRCRTMSTGSTGSFSASSSFSSSVGGGGGASFSIGSPLNHGPANGPMGNAAWKKGANHQQQQQHAGSFVNNHNYNGSNANNSSSIHLSTNNQNNNVNNANNQEANLKSDAECLNNMLATMSSKLNLQNTESLEEKLASTGNIFYRHVVFISVKKSSKHTKI